jgi:hypothetical protein
MRVVSKNNDVSTAELYQPAMRKDGSTYTKNDLQAAKFKVVAEVGPSSNSKRKATVESLMQMMSVPGLDPETVAILSTTVMMNMEGEGLSEMQDYWRNKLIKLGVIKPNEKEAAMMQQEMANQQPDANQVYLQEAAKNEQAKAKKAEAETIQALANSEKAKAQTIEIISNIDMATQQHAIETAQAIGGAIGSNPRDIQPATGQPSTMPEQQ